MALKGKGHRGKRIAMRERDRIVIYLEEAEKRQIEGAARDLRVSVSAFSAPLLLEAARRVHDRAQGGLAAAPNDRQTSHPLLAYQGILKDVFDELGGGEEFLRRERKDFDKAMRKREHLWGRPR